MRIQIRNRYKLFTHRPGAFVILPFSEYFLQIFPAKIFVFKGDVQIAEIDVSYESPPDSFVIELDLEKGNITIHGNAGSVFFRTFIFFDEKIIFHIDKPYGQYQTVSDLIRFQKNKLKRTISTERISFGIFKKPLFEKVQEREDLREILPLWHALAKVIPKAAVDFSKPSLLLELKEAIERQEKERVMPLFKALFRGGLQSLFFPRVQEFMGFNKAPFMARSPLALLSEGADLIRSLLIRYETGTLTLLPLVPRELSSGRITGFPIGDLGFFDCMWRSGKIIESAISPNADMELNLLLPKEIKTFRVRDLKNKNTRYSGIEPLLLKKDAYTFLDRFSS